MALAHNIKLIALDVDGTVAVDGRVVTPELKHLILGLRERGIVTALCTGRMPHWTEAIADSLGVEEYLICTDGGHALHRASGVKLHYPTIHASVVEQVARLADNGSSLDVASIGDDVLWATSDLARERTHWWGHRCGGIGDVRQTPPSVLLIVFGPHEAVGEARATLCEELNAEAGIVYGVEDQGDYAHFKVCHPEADKGVAAEKLVEHLGGDRSQILAFGDYLNDLGIMRRAGYSICPRDAHPVIRDAASHVSPHTAEEGFVAKEIKRIFDLG